MSEVWTKGLYHGRKGLQVLVERSLISAQEATELYPVIERFSFFVSDHYLNLADPEDPHCPIRRQIIPSLDELVETPGEMLDPIGDSTHEAVPGLIHRYPDRALLFLTHQCPIMCRFCFRKVYLNEEKPARFKKRLEDAAAYLRRKSAIREIILSGGDPLLLSNRRLETLLETVSEIDSIKSIRFHTRMLAAAPGRVDSHLLRLLDERDGITMVLHVNHAKEWTNEAREASRKLRRSGVRLLSQSVLLGGVNDNELALRELFRTLGESGCTPYYLHHPDKTVGTQHFRVSIERGLELMNILRGTAPGYSIPTYILDLPGGHGKIPVDSHYLSRTREPGIWEWRSPFGTSGLYHDAAHDPKEEKVTRFRVAGRHGQ